jgi:methionyl aminopeptidase
MMMISEELAQRPIARKSRHELRLIQEAGKIVADTHRHLMQIIEPGMSTYDLDQIAEQRIRKAGALPTFKGLYGFPATLCTSINEEIVHGIPNPERILKDGDIVSLDVGATYRGWIADSAITVAVGTVSDEVRQLLERTEEGLMAGVSKMCPGNQLQDVCGAIEDVGIKYGYGIVRNYGGHGVGKKLHEEPFVPNFRTGDPGPTLYSGNVLALEPMFNLGTEEVETLEDQWTVVTQDRKPSAHFEHTVIVTDDGPLVATWRDPL